MARQATGSARRRQGPGTSPGPVASSLRSMLAVCAAAVNVTVSVVSVVTEMVAVIAVPVAAGVGIVKGAIVPPVAVVERAVIAVIVAVIIVADADANTDATAACFNRATRHQQRCQSGRNGQNFRIHIRLQFLRMRRKPLCANVQALDWMQGNGRPLRYPSGSSARRRRAMARPK